MEKKAFHREPVSDLVFEREYLHRAPSWKDRLNELRSNARDKGLRGDRVYEFIALEVREGLESSQKTIEERDKRIAELELCLNSVINIDTKYIDTAKEETATYRDYYLDSCDEINKVL